jgi:hypothetical protein
MSADQQDLDQHAAESGWLPQPQPPVQPKKRHRVRNALLIALAAFAVLIIAVAMSGTSNNTKPNAPTASQPRETAPASEPTVQAPSEEPAAPAYHTPTRGDFGLKLKIKSWEDFDTAGAIATFSVKLSYDGSKGKLDPDKTYEITYKVQGSGDEYINTLTVTGDDYFADEDEMLDVPAGVSRSDLSVKIMSVEEA